LASARLSRVSGRSLPVTAETTRDDRFCPAPEMDS
jgi:hypothetical protein